MSDCMQCDREAGFKAWTESKRVDADTTDTKTPTENTDLRPSEVRSDALLDSLNLLWRDDCMMLCSLPCEDPACREDMDEDGGCMGADFADKLIAAMESNAR